MNMLRDDCMMIWLWVWSWIWIWTRIWNMKMNMNMICCEMLGGHVIWWEYEYENEDEYECPPSLLPSLASLTPPKRNDQSGRMSEWVRHIYLIINIVILILVPDIIIRYRIWSNGQLITYSCWYHIIPYHIIRYPAYSNPSHYSSYHTASCSHFMILHQIISYS